MGATRGIYADDLTLEDIATRIDEIRSEEGYAVPADVNEEMEGLLMQHLR